MKSSLFALLAGCAALSLTAPALANADPVQTEAKQLAEGEKLRAIFAEDDEASLKRNPLSALFRGDMRYADRLGDFVSDAYYDAERKAAEDNVAKLKGVKKAELNATDKIAYDVFMRNQQDAIKGLSQPYFDLTVVRPLNHFFGFHTFYPNFASGQGAAPFKTIEDYENNLKRHKEFVTLIDAFDRPVPSGHGIGRGRNQNDDHQCHRPARHAVETDGRGIALFRPDQDVS